LSIGLISFFRSSEKNVTAPINQVAETVDTGGHIDSFYQQLIREKIDSILLLKVLNYSTGIKGIVIWKQSGVLNATRFLSDVNGIYIQQQIDTSNSKLKMIEQEYFSKVNVIDSLEPSSIETLHDAWVIIRSIVQGNQKSYRFGISLTYNNPALLAKISNLCYEVIYGYTD
jgi:hypothetical protein